MRINLVERILVVLYENPEGTCGFSEKIAKVNPLYRIVQSVPSDWESVLRDCNSFSRYKQFVLSDRNCLIRGNELQSEKGLSNSRERITNPWERNTHPCELIAQFDLTIYLWLFWKISMSLQSFRSFAPNSCSHWAVSLQYFKIIIEGRNFSYFIVFFFLVWDIVFIRIEKNDIT